jgi:hypothetical protein
MVQQGMPPQGTVMQQGMPPAQWGGQPSQIPQGAVVPPQAQWAVQPSQMPHGTVMQQGMPPQGAVMQQGPAPAAWAVQPAQLPQGAVMQQGVQPAAWPVQPYQAPQGAVAPQGIPQVPQGAMVQQGLPPQGAVMQQGLQPSPWAVQAPQMPPGTFTPQGLPPATRFVQVPQASQGAIPPPPADPTVTPNVGGIPSISPPPGDAPALPIGPEATMPFKWSWGGQYRIEPDASNFNFHPLFIPNDAQTESFVNQRMRLWATVNPDEHIEGYIQFQIGGVLWGQNLDLPKTFDGPKFPAAEDRVGIMLRHGWIAYSDDECGKWRAGFLDWHDSFGDTLASSDYEFDIGGVDWTKVFKDYNNLRVVLAALYLSDLPLVTTEDVPLGSHTAWLLTADVDQPLSPTTSVGASIYYLTDRGDYSYPLAFPYRSSWGLWLGVRAKTVVMDSVPINGFAIYNADVLNTDAPQPGVHQNAFAGKFEVGPVELGPGKLSGQVIYASNEFRTVAQTYHDNFGAQGYWSYLQLTSPNGPSDVQDLGVSLQNEGYGLFTVQAKYEYPICGKLSGTSAAGYLRSSAHNALNGSSDMGTEISQMFTYNFGHGLTLDFGAAWLFTGDFYKESPTSASPADLWELFSRLQLEF